MRRLVLTTQKNKWIWLVGLSGAGVEGIPQLKFLQFCFTLVLMKVVMYLICSVLLKEGCHPNLIQEINWEGGCFSRVEKGSSQLNRAYTGLLKGRVFPGWRFSGWGLVGFQSLGLNMLRDWLYFMFCAQGLVGFHAELVMDRVCFLALVSGPGCVSLAVPFTLHVSI